MLALVPVLAGCGGSEMPMVPVSGTLTFNGGPPPARGAINFMLVDGTGKSGLPNRPGGATFGTDGKFVVSSYKQGDGLMPGTYTATVVCFVGSPSEADPSSYARLSRVPEDYHPELIVQEGAEPIVVTLDVPEKK